MMFDPYEMLGIARDATPAAIRKAYRSKAQQLHPDRNPGDPTATTRFQELNDAYETLMDEDRRRRYDESGDHNDPKVDLRRRSSALVAEIVLREAFKWPEDILTPLRLMLTNMEMAASEQMSLARVQIRTHERQLKRLKFNGRGVDHIRFTLETKIQRCQEAVEQSEKAIEEVVDARVFLAEYETLTEHTRGVTYTRVLLPSGFTISEGPGNVNFDTT